MFDELKELLRKNNESTSYHVSSRFQQHEETLAEKEYCRQFLESLWFPEIHAREEGIKDAHEKTFRWLFDDSHNSARPWDDFVKWLECGRGTYWISGKAGSGKSTLMRYLCHNDRTTNSLRVWAGSREPLLIKFFFWSAGSPVQKSFVGLFRSLFYQILSALPKLITLISVNRPCPASQYGPIPAWTEARLKKSLKLVIREVASSHRLCFFLDGLDELDESHENLVSQVRDLVEINDIKICLSSRPYRVFSEAFSSTAMLRLHDLTESDVLAYVSESLISRGSDAASDMSKNIVQRANGVFLWAELAVREMNRGLTNRDSPQQLKKRLYSLPDEIEELYGHMLECIDTVYREEAARSFIVAMSSPSLLTFSLEVHEALHYDPLAFTKLSATQTLKLCKSTEKRLPTICAGFLEVQRDKHGFGTTNNTDLYELARLTLPSQFAIPDIDLDKIPPDIVDLFSIEVNERVEFIHRTAIDFLRNNKQGMKLIEDSKKHSLSESALRMNTMVAKWRLLGCVKPQLALLRCETGREFLRQNSRLSLGLSLSLVASAAASGESSVSYGLAQDKFRDWTVDPLMRVALQSERSTGAAQVTLWNYVERATRTAKSRYLTQLLGHPYEQLPHTSCEFEKPCTETQRAGAEQTNLYSEIKTLSRSASENSWQSNGKEATVVSSKPVDFLGFTAYYGLSLYVRHRLDSDPRLQCRTTATYLLACLVSNVKWIFSKYSSRDYQLMCCVSDLLDRGADPNAVTFSSTIWGDFLEKLYHSHCDAVLNSTSRATVSNKAWVMATIAFLEKGANTTRTLELCSATAWTPSLKLNDEQPADELPDLVTADFKFGGQSTTFTILQHCFNSCDEWADIKERLTAQHLQPFFKCTQIYLSKLGSPEAWVEYTLSEQQSKDFTQAYEQCTRSFGAARLPAKRRFFRQILDLRHELEGAQPDPGTSSMKSGSIPPPSVHTTDIEPSDEE